MLTIISKHQGRFLYIHRPTETGKPDNGNGHGKVMKRENIAKGNGNLPLHFTKFVPFLLKPRNLI